MAVLINDAVQVGSQGGGSGTTYAFAITITEPTTRMAIFCATGANAGANISSMTWSRDAKTWTQYDSEVVGGERQFHGYIERPEVGAGNLTMVTSIAAHKILAVVGLSGDARGAESDNNQGSGDRTLTTKRGSMCFSTYVATIDPGATPDAGSTFLFEEFQGGASYNNIWLEGIYKQATSTSTTLGWAGAYDQIGVGYDPIIPGSQVIMMASRIQELYNEMRSGRIPSDELVRRYRELTNTLRPLEGPHELAI